MHTYSSLAVPLQIPCKSYVSPIFRLFQGTDLERFCNGGITDLKRRQSEGIAEAERRHKRAIYFIPLICNVEITSVIFFRIKRPTRTCSGKLLLSILISNKLRACTCLSNIYITRTWVVMPYFFTNCAETCTRTDMCAKNMYLLCTTYVRVWQTHTCY